jgi:hypothetical protein
MNVELWRMWKEVAVAYIKVVSQYILGGTEEYQRKLQNMKESSRIENRALRLRIRSKIFQYLSAMLIRILYI